MFKIREYRRLLLVCALGLFLMSATNALFAWHLHYHHIIAAQSHGQNDSDRHNHHDPDNCAICKNFITTSGKCLTAPNITVVDLFEVVDVYFSHDNPITVTLHAPCGPRAPPAAPLS